MTSRATIAGHPIHPMLVVFPIGLFVFSLISDLIYLGNRDPIWIDVAYYTMAGGIIGALAAAVPGLIDVFSIDDAHVRKIGLTHMAINLTVVVLYLVNLWLRSGPGSLTLPTWLSVVSVALLAVSGWLGGEMVYVHGVGVGTGSRPERNVTRLRRPASRQ